MGRGEGLAVLANVACPQSLILGCATIQSIHEQAIDRQGNPDPLLLPCTFAKRVQYLSERMCVPKTVSKIRMILNKQRVYNSFDIQPFIIPDSKDSVLNTLEAGGFRVQSQRFNEHELKIEAIYGSKSQAFLAQCIPSFLYFALTGYGSRVYVTIHVRKKLDTHDPAMHMSLSSEPLMELLDEPEQFLMTQGLAERIGDGKQCQRVLRKLRRKLFGNPFIKRA